MNNMNNIYLTFLLLLFLASCNAVSENTSMDIFNSSSVSKDSFKYKIIVKFKTDLNGNTEKTTILNSRVTGSEYRGQGRVQTYNNEFENGKYINFKSSSGVINIRCRGVSDIVEWRKFYGGEFKLKNGKKIVIINDLGVVGKRINNKKYISQKFLESEECFREYGLQLISYDVVKMD